MKTLLFLIFTAALLLGTCSPAQLVTPSVDQPAEVSTLPATEPTSVSTDVLQTVGFQSVQVSDVSVEVGVGSPIPVFVDIGASLPDTCAQVEVVEVLQDRTFFNIYVGTMPSADEACLKDTVPFRMKLPLSIVGLPAGTYNVEVNSVPAEFKLESDITSGDLRTRQTPVIKQDLVVHDVSIEMGVGSPRPVTAVISADLPNSCAQIGEVQLWRDRTTYFVRLIADIPEQTDCNPDTLPMRIEFPLNTISLPDGTYQVVVNGTTATFEMPLK